VTNQQVVPKELMVVLVVVLRLQSKTKIIKSKTTQDFYLGMYRWSTTQST